jgi:hypothetical protein
MSAWFWILVTVFIGGLWFFKRASEQKVQCERLVASPKPWKRDPNGRLN